MLTWSTVFIACIVANLCDRIIFGIIRTVVEIHKRRKAAVLGERLAAYLGEVQDGDSRKTPEQIEDIASKHGFAMDDYGRLIDKKSSQG